MFFSFPRQELLVLSTLILGPIMYFFSSTNLSTTKDTDFQNIKDIQFDFIDQYLLWAKIPLILILSLITYKWSTIRKDGSYGYWLSLGANRSYFFIYAVSTFIINVFFGNLLGFAIIIFPGGINLSINQIITLLLLLLSSNFLLIGLALLFAELINMPELASISFIALLGVNLVFNRNNSNLLSLILLSEFQFRTENVILPLLLSAFFGIFCIIGAMQLHRRTDIDI